MYARLLVTLLAALCLCHSVLAAPRKATAPDSALAHAEKAQRKEFSDAEILDGFLKTAIGSELQRGDAENRIRKYERPIRVFLDNRAHPDRRHIVEKILDDIRSKIAHLDLAVTENRADANISIMLIRERDFAKTLRSYYGAEQATNIERSLEPQCLAGLAKDPSFKIVRSEVFLIVDVSDFVFRDCAYEEILQALGPINDVDSVPWTMFNDDVSFGFFDVYDQLLLNILYHPRIKAGMTSEEARAVVPEILPEVRAIVARNNEATR
jgi:hypothetical protein